MENSPLVSVVTASYNAAPFLPTALSSALGQTHQSLEVLLIDDGSTDNTVEVVRPFLADPRLRYLHQENRGQSRAKNRGIRESRGAFVAFLDADDAWVPEKLAKQLPLFTSPEIGVVYSDAMFIDQDGVMFSRPRPRYCAGRVTQELFVDNFVPFDSSVVRRECFQAVGPFDESLRMGIDWDLWLRISTQFEFAYLNEPTLCYRVWSGQMSRDIDGRFECTTRIMNQFVEKYGTFLSPQVKRLAWAHTYTGRARHLSDAGRQGEAWHSLARALARKPSYSPAWRALVVLLLRLGVGDDR